VHAGSKSKVKDESGEVTECRMSAWGSAPVQQST